MPELPDIQAYLHALQPRILGRRLERILIRHVFLLRSVDPPPAELEGKRVVGLRRLGKRIVIEVEGELFLVIHLMIAGRLHWKPAGAKAPGKAALAVFEFEDGILWLSEAGTKRRAALYLARGEAGLDRLDPGGLEVMEADPEQFRAALVRENHTLKRALTDPHLFSGIGNAYSDEILHRARLSPFKLTTRLSDEEHVQLFAAVQGVLGEWTARLQAEADDAFPEHVTAFREEMAVHGRYGKPCPVCGSPVQRIVYAENECNYCATCQSEGRLFADRGLSRLLREDWPRTPEELEAMRERHRAGEVRG